VPVKKGRLKTLRGTVAFHWSTSSAACAVLPPTNALSQVPAALKGVLLGQERCQSLHASPGHVLLTERAVEHHRRSNHQHVVKACPAESQNGRGWKGPLWVI